MDTITFKVDKDLAKAMEKVMKPLYATKTEFIREAIRKHINDLETENSVRELMKLKGSLKKNITDADLRRTREEVSEQLLKEYGLKKNNRTNIIKS